jgi:hypothetical protein
MTTLETKWNCHRCNEILDAATAVSRKGEPFEPAPPKPGDVSLCIACGFVHERTADNTWKAITPENFARLPLNVLSLVAQVENARREVTRKRTQ